MQCGRERFDLLRAFETLHLNPTVEIPLVALGFAAAQVRFADLGMHHFAGRRDPEPFGGRFVRLQFGHSVCLHRSIIAMRTSPIITAIAIYSQIDARIETGTTSELLD